MSENKRFFVGMQFDTAWNWAKQNPDAFGRESNIEISQGQATKLLDKIAEEFGESDPARKIGIEFNKIPSEILGMRKGFTASDIENVHHILQAAYGDEYDTPFANLRDAFADHMTTVNREAARS